MCKETLDELKKCSAELEEKSIPPEVQIEMLWKSCTALKGIMLQMTGVLDSCSKALCLGPTVERDVKNLRQSILALPSTKEMYEHDQPSGTP